MSAAHVGEPGGATLPPIDPLGPAGPGGWYVDDLVRVRAVGTLRQWSRDSVRTEHFDVRHVGVRVHVDHWVPPSRIDDDLAGLLADELFTPGWLRGTELFERVFTGVVRSGAGDPLERWLLFYRNSLVGIAREVAGAASGAASTSASSSGSASESGSGSGSGHGTIAGYAPVYDHAEGLLADGSVLELGSCFGFLSLRLAGRGRRVTASDVSAGTMRLLATTAPLLGVRLETRVADAARVPAPDRSADTVLALHLLEHLDPAHGDRVVAEAVRLARRRVVVAVPLEDVADETWGHVRTVTLDDLRAWGRSTGLPYDVHEHHGGWLVVETG
ncbi:mycofactocin oligosaccharide methyltransferase MftM [Nocardioides aurantiacus]|uniref:Methyltransferase family protein n=1 Tax=Nocardioides aurantiacus TaxID=86796 RepID=A0A3N2CZF0_9ACTN|nr:mycofactocin oligosaccharide methyltransferase MftM [Nocardioides aurantiacus]ROR92866.1 methyltransferase family protein [Nocardioides aurantiacus]